MAMAMAAEREGAAMTSMDEAGGRRRRQRLPLDVRGAVYA
jgi:predicted nucleic acid-binding protein